MTDQPWPEADRKFFDRHARQLRGEEMAAFVCQDQHEERTEEDQKRGQRGHSSVSDCMTRTLFVCSVTRTASESLTPITHTIWF